MTPGKDAIFDKAHAFVAQWEGGFINHPSDPGGATNRGVSLRWLRSIGMDINGDGDIDVDDIKAVTPEIAKGLFRAHFWQPCGCDALPPRVAVVLYDGAVNMGVSRAVSQVQTACNRFAGDAIAIDGAMGPRTLARVYALSERDTTAFCRDILFIRERFYRNLASNSRYTPFLAGWINRVVSLSGYLVQLGKEGY